MDRRTIIVVGTVASDPYAGMAWMTMQIVAGLRRLGHDAWYFELTSTWPYDPVRKSRVAESDYAIKYLRDVVQRFDLDGRWAYRRSYSDKAWLGLSTRCSEDLLAHADLVFNIAGATRFAEEGLKTGRLVYFGTDPVYHELKYANGDADVHSIVNEHDLVVTYGENIGKPSCRVPPLPRLRAHTRQPVLLDYWRATRSRDGAFTTVGNWKQGGRDVEYDGQRYLWSKHHEFLRFIELPRRAREEIELATNLAPSSGMCHGRGTEIPVLGFEVDEYELLKSHGWRLVDGPALSTDPWRYRDYIFSSRAEFTVARDLNVRLRSGWFSERSACYLAAGKPVVTQDTGFGSVLPTGEGLFAFNTIDEAIGAIDSINSDYGRHSAAAQAIAVEYFQAETVLRTLLETLA